MTQHDFAKVLLLFSEANSRATSWIKKLCILTKSSEYSTLSSRHASIKLSIMYSPSARKQLKTFKIPCALSNFQYLGFLSIQPKKLIYWMEWPISKYLPFISQCEIQLNNPCLFLSKFLFFKSFICTLRM